MVEWTRKGGEKRTTEPTGKASNVTWAHLTRRRSGDPKGAVLGVAHAPQHSHFGCRETMRSIALPDRLLGLLPLGVLLFD
jgi:hypothetical protein